MALEKAKKQVLLYGGVNDNVDDFLIEPPGVEYAENRHWRGKEGVLSRRMGMTVQADVITGLPVDSRGPSVLHPIGNTLHTFASGASHSYDIVNDTWSSKPQPDAFARGERFAASSQTGNHCGHTAYTSRSQLSGAIGRSVVCTGLSPTTTEVQIYDESNSLQYTEVISGGFPQIVQSVLGPCVITGNGNNLERRYVNLAEVSIGTKVTLKTDLSKQFIYDHTNNVSVSIFDMHQENNHFCVIAPQDTTGYHIGAKAILAYLRTDGTMQVMQSSDGFATVDFEFNSVPSPSRDVRYPLAICEGEAGTDTYYILYASHSYPPATEINNHTLAMFSKDATTATPTNVSTDWIDAATSMAFMTAATIQYRDADDHVYLALTLETDRTYLQTFFSTLAGDDQTEAIIYNHRVTGNLIEYNDEMYLGLTMLGLYNSYESIVETDSPDSFASYHVPSTNTLVKVTDVSSPEVIAQVDVGQSRHSDWSNRFNYTHIGSISHGAADTLVMSSREVFGAEDVWRGSVDTTSTQRKTDGAKSRTNAYRIEFNPTSKLRGIGFGDGLVLPGGCTMWYDGSFLSELSPLNSPRIIFVADDTAANPSSLGPIMCDEPKESFRTKFGTTPSDTNHFRKAQAVIGYTDASGNEHRSAPSPLMYISGFNPSLRTLESWKQGYDGTVTVAVPLTMNANAGSRYFVEGYISDDETGIPKLASRTNYDPAAAKGEVLVSLRASEYVGDDISFTDALIRPVSRYTEFVYTAGGELPADPWPTITQGVATSTRMFGLSRLDSGQVYYSKRFAELTTPEFSVSNIIALGDERNLTAIGKLDDKIVVFEPQDIHVIYGDGPDNTGKAGRDGGFSVHHVTSDVGCDQPESVVETPSGLIFKSRRGFYILDRSLKLQFIGGPVQDMSYNATVKTAQIVPEFAEVRFGMVDRTAGTFVPESGPTPTGSGPARPKFANELPDDACLVYNYEFNRWTVFSGYLGDVYALYGDGRFAYISSTFVPYLEAAIEDDAWLDGAVPYTSTIVTPPIPLAENIQGFARLRRVTLLGRYLSSYNLNRNGATMAGDIKVTMRYDYENADSDTHTYRANVELKDGISRLQFRVKPARQKCQAVQFIIEDEPTTSYFLDDPATYAYGRGFEITAIDLDLGIKDGPVRTLSAGRKR